MNLSAIAIRRPVFIVMMTLGILVLGVMGFRSLGTDLYPDVSFPVVLINTAYPGAGPGEVETLVSKPIEDAVVGLNGIDRLRSFSREGLSTTVIFFKLGVNLPEMATQVRERVAEIRHSLPTDVKEPTISRFDVSAAPVLIYTLRGDHPLSWLRKYAEDTIKPELEQVDGVASVEIMGGSLREIHVDLDRSRLEALKIDPSIVVERLRAANLTVPAGHYDQGAREISVRSIGELKDTDAVRNVIVATAKDGSAVRLRDIAEVEDGFEEARTRVRANGEEAVSFQIVKQSGENTIAVSDAAKARLVKLEKDFPKGVRADVIFEQARFIKDNVREVETALVFGGAMAILVILIFMLDLRSTLISSVALPTSVIGTFFVMYLLGYTLNMMTLLGLSLAIGLLIDDAVVVRENIFKHLERGKPPRQAALDGTSEIALAVLATTATIVAVFLPVAFVKGLVGQFFRQFGITISAAVILSLLVAFTLDPMLSSRFSVSLAEKHDDRWRWLKRPMERTFAATERGYRALLGFALRHKLLVGGLALCSLVLTGYVAKLMGGEFMAAEDRGQFTVEIELPAGTSLAETSRISAIGEDELLKNKEVKVVFATVGEKGESNKAGWEVVTTTKEQRSTPIGVLKDAARKAAMDAAPGAKVTVADPAAVEGAAVEAPIMIDVRGNTYGDIVPLANQVAEILRTTPGVQDVQVKYTPGRPELRLELDRQKAADRGVGVARAALALRTAMEGEEAGKLRQGKDEVPILVRLRKSDRERPADLLRLPIATPKGMVRLGDLAKLSNGEGPQVIEREARSRQIQIWAAPRGRPLGDLLAEFGPRIAKLKLPAGAAYAYDGQIRMMNETNSNMGVALGLGVLFIFLVLASQFESVIHPFTIMFTLPLGLVGAVLALFLTGNTMAMGPLIGIILLMGLVTKNAILLVDRAIVRVREHDEPPLQAILEAGPERLRPILMTSAAMVLGMLPTAMSHGEGSEFRGPMAIAVIGGVISSTLLSLVVVPVVYLAIENSKGWLAKKLGRKGGAARPANERARAERAAGGE